MDNLVEDGNFIGIHIKDNTILITIKMWLTVNTKNLRSLLSTTDYNWDRIKKEKWNQDFFLMY